MTEKAPARWIVSLVRQIYVWLIVLTIGGMLVHISPAEVPRWSADHRDPRSLQADRGREPSTRRASTFAAKAAAAKSW